MNDPHGEWSALKVDWQTVPLAVLATETLRAGLRWRILWSRVYLAIEIGAVVMMAILIGQQWMLGQWRPAVGMSVLTLACIAASLWARSSKLEGSLTNVVGMVDIGITRATRGVRFAFASYGMTIATGLYIAFMYVSSRDVPDMAYRDPERATVAFALLALYAAGTAIYHRYVHVRRRRLVAVRRLLGGADVAEAGRPPQRS